MSGTSEDISAGSGPPPGGREAGMLANLPRARPQRSSARRDAARRTRTASSQTRAANGKAGPDSETKAVIETRAGGVETGPDRRAKPRPDRPGTRQQRRSSRVRLVEEPVPRQGFACDEESVRGPVQPPGRTELIAAAAEALGELAKAGVAGGERLVRDLLSRLPSG